MASSVAPRSVTPVIEFLRSIFRGKALKANSLRFANQIAARTQLQPDLPGGPYKKSTGIYYYTRDVRREVKPPITVCTANRLALSKEIEAVKNFSPGKVYQPN
ncbi:NADH dehydrogenase [ubiquinone] 1 alpha subcomplex subunit 7 [Nasonia vitripennis]|uniref:NADH dehydrogenase [ubiquinone] 1 alpha subcomplex subunit 7 n=1 Tax=Nasonia vitripennis TaxID=7425 RepID=A0A7M6UP28_NASVI|nr:NADH dehydrogenase [ubiquinone] 1 alpha subcomplex subunit 7 [Nasonia vitripennis]